MSRTKTSAGEDSLSMQEAKAAEVDSNEKSEEGTAVETQPGITENASTAGSEAAVMEAYEKKYGIVRYFQMHPIENKTLERTLRKMYGSEAHTSAGWGQVISDFLNQKV